MSVFGNLVVNLRANTAVFDSKMRGSTKHMSTFALASKKASSMLTAFGAGIGLYAAYRGIKSLTRAAMEQERVELELAAALRQTGDLTSSNLYELKQYATEMQRLTVYGDEATLTEMAYGKNLGISAAKLKDATKAAMGLAAKYKIDLHSSMMLIGRASMGQTQMLTRYGIIIDQSLSPQEKFNALLKIGADNFGLAKEAANTTAGKIEQATNAWGDLKEQVGVLALPGIAATAKALTEINNAIATGSAWSDMTKGQRERLALPVSDEKAVKNAWQSYLTEQRHFYRIAETASERDVDAQWDKYMLAQKEWQQTVNLYNHQKLITAELKNQNKLKNEQHKKFMGSFLGRALSDVIQKYRVLSGWSKDSFFGRSLSGMIDKLKAGSKGSEDQGGGQFLNDYWREAMGNVLRSTDPAKATATNTERTAKATETVGDRIKNMEKVMAERLSSITEIMSERSSSMQTGLRFGV